MPTTHLLGVFLALISASSWGAGDFGGGVASRRLHPFQTLALVAPAAWVALMLGAFARGEGLPSVLSCIWAGAAGLAGALGTAALYRGLSLGNSALVSPVAAVIGAGIPVVFGVALEGLPNVPQLAGFAAGLAGIWMVASMADDQPSGQSRGAWLALAAGLGFGAFFLLIAQVEPGAVFVPLAIVKAVAFAVANICVRWRGLSLPSLRGNGVALAAGVLDAGGNAFYLLARQYTRLDVAVVLSSMYPAVTVLLASMALHERVSARQWVGVLLCVAAVALIAL
jgi:drug/metabolite transporter (DMT)-like permease